MMTEQQLQDAEARLDDTAEICGDMMNICADAEGAVLLSMVAPTMQALIAEVRRLQQQANGWRVSADLIAERDAALAERDVWKARAEAQIQVIRHEPRAKALTEARRVLREVEWVSQRGKISRLFQPEWAWCPCCGKTRQEDHTPADCALAAVLAQEEPS